MLPSGSLRTETLSNRAAAYNPERNRAAAPLVGVHAPNTEASKCCGSRLLERITRHDKPIHVAHFCCVARKNDPINFVVVRRVGFGWLLSVFRLLLLLMNDRLVVCDATRINT